MAPASRAHDRALLDALDAIPPVRFEGPVWRITRTGRDPLQGSTANGRWTPANVEVLYTSLDRDGALAEIGYRLSLEPVWPSRIAHTLHHITAKADRALHIASTASLAPLGIDPARYATFDYTATQALAAAAHFLDFDGLLVPSARHSATNLVLFTDRAAVGALIVRASEPFDWAAWRRDGDDAT